MRPLVVLRPEPGASASVARARELGLEARAMPLFEVCAAQWDIPEAADFDALLLTSANAIRHAGAGLAKLRALPVYAVGPATAAAALGAGLGVRQVGDGGVGDLLARLPSGLRLLHLCGAVRVEADRGADRITAIPVYRAGALPEPEDFAAVAGTVALVHSPLAGARLGELADARGIDRRQVRIAAISPTAAEAAGGGWAVAASVPRPDEGALLELAARLCDDRGQE